MPGIEGGFEGLPGERDGATEGLHGSLLEHGRSDLRRTDAARQAVTDQAADDVVGLAKGELGFGDQSVGEIGRLGPVLAGPLCEQIPLKL